MQSCLKKILQFTNYWKCQCLMINNLALWMDDHQLFQKSLEILATIVSFLTLILSMLSIRGKQQILQYLPAYGHYLRNAIQNIESQDFYKQNCHYFPHLKYVQFVGFNRLTFYQIRLGILFALFVTDMLGLLFSFVYPSCGTKMYVFGLVITLLFFVLFPSQLCINFGNDCIQYSPIFLIYRIEFMIQFNVAWIGIGAIGLIIIIYPITYLSKRCCNLSLINEIFYDTIYGIVCIPFFAIAIINFVTALWTSSAIINILTFMSTIINYLLYHSSTDIRSQISQKQRLIQKTLNNPQQGCKLNLNNIQIGEYEFVENDNFTFERINSIDELNKQLRGNDFISPQKPDRMIFYRQWQNRLYRQFHDT